jgi:type II secretory pathway predicted ATPase ExeA
MTSRSRHEFDLDATLRRWEEAYIEAAQQLGHGNMSQAARLLGVNRTTLYNRIDTLAREKRASTAISAKDRPTDDMYLEHFGLNEPPFRITPHTDFFFDGANRGATLDALLYAITHDEGIVKVSGEVGSGKTMLCRVLMERLPENVETVYLANPSLSRDEILYAIADELQPRRLGPTRVSAVMRALQEHLIEHLR